MPAHVDAWEVDERRGIGGDDHPASRSGGRCDDEVVGTAWRALPSDVGEQEGVGFGRSGIVGDDRNRREDVFDERRSSPRGCPAAQQRSSAELGDGDGCDRDIVVITDHLVETTAGPVCVDQERRVEQ